ncbi:hypothetical protein niasHS_006189 [Heterodera schachtii]|uniref:Uncharacterized protein n=1 Tax=Heterodera schachtii TaxID=97005 RepID=A0ABD2JSU9_HETSC
MAYLSRTTTPLNTTTMLLNLALFCQCVHSLVIHPRLRSTSAAVAARQIGSGPETTVAEDKQLQHLIDIGRSSDKSKRMRWYGAEAKQMLRHLDEIRLRTEAAQRNAVSKVGKVSLLDKLFALFTDKPDDEGPKHDCFFSAFNCPVNPARNIPGVRRVRITADERRKLLAAKQRAAGTRKGHRTTTTITSNGFEAVPLKQEGGTTTD